MLISIVGKDLPMPKTTLVQHTPSLLVDKINLQALVSKEPHQGIIVIRNKTEVTRKATAGDGLGTI